MKYAEASYLMKKRLANTLHDALTQRSFSKITVSDIVADCGVNRKTFYYHFADIHALLRWMFTDEFESLIKSYDMLNDYVAIANGVMDYVEQNEALFHNIVDTVGEDSLNRALYDNVHALQNKVVSGFENRYQISFEEPFRAFLVKFLSDAIVGILMEWVRNRRYRNREITIEYLRDFFRVAIPSLIEHRVHLAE